MIHTAESVAALAASVEAEFSQLLTRADSNPKTAKSAAYGWLDEGLMLSPARTSGINVCAWSTGCADVCLDTSGLGERLTGVHVARIRKTKWLFADRNGFMRQYARELRAGLRRAERKGLRYCNRPNTLSDLPWERMAFTLDGVRWPNIMAMFPDVQFYDYTKVATRLTRELPPNYDLTYSWAETPRARRGAALAFERGFRVAVVFRNTQRPLALPRMWELPTEYLGRPVVDADKHDLRFLEEGGVWCGLKAKGHARRDTSGFVIDVDPRC